MIAPAQTGIVAHDPGCRTCDIDVNGDRRGMLSPAEIATRWGTPVATIHRLIREERIPILNLSPGSRGGKGPRYRVSACVVRALEASRDAPIPPL